MDIIPLAKRNDYMVALEATGTDGNIRPFANFLAGLLGEPNK